MPKNFPARQFLRKVNNCFGLFIVKLFVVYMFTL